MKKIIFLAGVGVIIVAIYYFAPWSQWSVSGRSRPASQSGGRVLGAEAPPTTAGFIRDFFSHAEDAALQGVNQAQTAAKGAIATTAQDALDQAKERAVQKVADFLGAPTSTRLTATPVPGTSPEACPLHAKGETLSYLLQFSTNASASDFFIDWGDGTSDEKSVASSAQNIVFAHAYQKEGDYGIALRSGGASGPTSAHWKACIR